MTTPERTKLIIDRAQQHGSKATTLSAAAKYCLRYRLTRPKAPSKKLSRVNLDKIKVGQSVELRPDWVYGFSFRSRLDHVGQCTAARTLGKQGKRRNYSDGNPQIYGQACQCRYETINYRGRYRNGSHLYRDYQSCIAISRSGRSAIVILLGILKRRIIAPKGTRFGRDQDGIFVRRLSDGMDYHPSPREWLDKAFATVVRTAMAANWRARASARKAEALAKCYADIRAREIGSTRVTLADSRRAGNCVEGSLAYAVRKLGCDRQEIIDGGYLFSVPASRVLAGGEPRAVAAVHAAWLRETAVCI